MTEVTTPLLELTAIWDHTVLPATQQRWHSSLYPGVLWLNGWMDQGDTLLGRPRPWPHCVRWGPSSPTERNTTAPTF